MKKRVILTIILVMCILTTTVYAQPSIRDMDSSHWAYKYVSYMVDREIMELDYGEIFPDTDTSRGDFVLYLWRTAGAPKFRPSKLTFVDIGEYSPYLSAVEWAVENKITTGTSATTFSPRDTLTREQAFTFLWRALLLFDYDTGDLTGNYIDEFKDAANVHQWAYEAMNGLCALGIVNGDGGYLRPEREVKKAETAAILYRTIELAGAFDPDRSDDDLTFTIYNDSGFDFYAIKILPADTEIEGIDVLEDVLKSGDSCEVQLPHDFDYTVSSEWWLRMTNEDGDSYVIKHSFYLKDLSSLYITWDWQIFLDVAYNPFK